MTWTLKFTPRATKELTELHKVLQRDIVQCFRKHILTRDTPWVFGKELGHHSQTSHRFHLYNQRILCHVDHREHTIIILRIGPRHSIYE